MPFMGFTPACLASPRKQTIASICYANMMESLGMLLACRRDELCSRTGSHMNVMIKRYYVDGIDSDS